MLSSHVCIGGRQTCTPRMPPADNLSGGAAVPKQAQYSKGPSQVLRSKHRSMKWRSRQPPGFRGRPVTSKQCAAKQKPGAAPARSSRPFPSASMRQAMLAPAGARAAKERRRLCRGGCDAWDGAWLPSPCAAACRRRLLQGTLSGARCACLDGGEVLLGALHWGKEGRGWGEILIATNCDVPMSCILHAVHNTTPHCSRQEDSVLMQSINVWHTVGMGFTAHIQLDWQTKCVEVCHCTLPMCDALWGRAS